jgi:hypothetical protein
LAHGIVVGVAEQNYTENYAEKETGYRCLGLIQLTLRLITHHHFDLS